MGQIVEKYCYKIILTNEDPYDEDPVKSIEEIKLFFDSLDFLLGQTEVNSFCFALNCATTVVSVTSL